MRDCDPVGFQWLVGDDRDASVLAYTRTGDADDPPIVVVANFTPVPRDGYRIGVPPFGSSGSGRAGFWKEILNSDATAYGGGGIGNRGGMHAEAVPCRGHDHSLVITAPPLAIVYFVAAS